jgi:hypothetical protein
MNFEHLNIQLGPGGLISGQEEDKMQSEHLLSKEASVIVNPSADL